jgi:hypothetical protein
MSCEPFIVTHGSAIGFRIAIVNRPVMVEPVQPKIMREVRRWWRLCWTRMREVKKAVEALVKPNEETKKMSAV